MIRLPSALLLLPFLACGADPPAVYLIHEPLPDEEPPLCGGAGGSGGEGGAAGTLGCTGGAAGESGRAP
ncbi:MAG: hypothetical protein RMJ98_08645 [Myxococcales bacterium]|nr:hypothetical protein [Polyangiaceae bacterium]MDW8249356.1 hypothetical protein [Myxococcales bacterium]